MKRFNFVDVFNITWNSTSDSGFKHCICSSQVIKRLPQLKKLDGIPIDVDERESAKA